MSAQPCGCDPEAHWLCEWHTKERELSSVQVVDKGQSRSQSLLESCSNVVVGFVISYLAQITIYPLLGIKMSTRDNLIAVFVFTLISIARSYSLRRFYNWKHR
jgi:hypothetical protein